MADNACDERSGRGNDPYHAHALTLLAAETLRKATMRSGAVPEHASAEGRFTVFWKVFGATLVSIAAMVILAVYQQFTGELSSLHAEINHLGESRSSLVGKDDFNGRMTTMWTAIKDLQAINLTLVALKERDAVLEEQIKAGTAERKQLLQELQQLRERLAAAEARAGIVPAVKITPVTAN